MFYNLRNILLMAGLLTVFGSGNLQAQGVVTLADGAAQEDEAVNNDIPDEISLFDETETIDELGSAAAAPAPKLPEAPAAAQPAAPTVPELSAPAASETAAPQQPFAMPGVVPLGGDGNIPLTSNKLMSQPEAGIGALASGERTVIDDKIFSQMSDLEKQTALLNLELRREKVKNEIEALKDQRRQAYKAEQEKEEAKKREQMEWEKAQEQKVLAEQQKLRELDIKFEELRQEKLLNEYKNKMLEDNQKWIERNADFYKQIANSKKDREELIKVTRGRFEQLRDSVKSATSKIQGLKAGYEKEITDLQNQVSVLKARIEVQEKEMEKQNPFAEGNAQAAAAAAMPGAAVSEIEIVEPELKLANMYAVMEIRGQGGELVAKLINQDGQPFYVKKGTALQSGHIIDDITSTYVRADKGGVKDYLYFAAGGILPIELNNSSSSTLRDELQRAGRNQDAPARDFVTSDTIPGMGRDMMAR